MKDSTKAQSPRAGAASDAALGRYSFDSLSQQLNRGTVPVRLTPKAAGLLALLVANRGRLVPREEIMSALWPDGFVHQNNLTQTIYLLRKTFADEPAVQIENVPCRGYRLSISAVSRRQSAGAFAASAALILLSLNFNSHPQALPQAANQSYRLALYHLQRPAELGLATKYFLQTERGAPHAPEGYAGVAVVDAMLAASPNARPRFCTAGAAAVKQSLANGRSALADAAQALLSFMCDHSAGSAERHIAAALRESPNDSIVVNFAARLALWMGNTHLAVDYARRAVQLQPDSPEAISTLGLAEYYDGRFASAATDLRRALEIMPNSPALRAYLAQSLEALGQTGDARGEIRPSHSDLNELAAANIADGRYDRALRVLERVRREDDMLAQLDWQSDYRFAALRRRFPALVTEFVTYR